jgi:putative ABC transport system permease protein
MSPLTRSVLSWLSLAHHPGRLAVSVAGVSLAVILMLMQVGFRQGMFDSQVELIAQLHADLVLINKEKELINTTDTFPRSRLRQAAATAGVRAAEPVYLERLRAVWRHPVDRSARCIRVVAFDPAADVFLFPQPRMHAAALRQPDTVLFDRRSRDYYGDPRPGTKTELAGRTVEVVGDFELGTDFLADGNLIMSDRNFLKLFPIPPAPRSRLNRVDIGVIRVEPSADPREVQAALRRTLPADVSVLTKDEYIRQETTYWHQNTAIGYVFALGTVVGFVVGSVICYQILYTNVTSHLPQFATLKAMGYTDSYLVSVVLQQAVLLAVLGFIPALAVSWLLYSVIGSITGLLMRLTILRLALVFALSLGMCVFAGFLAVRKVLQADPAENF